MKNKFGPTSLMVMVLIGVIVAIFIHPVAGIFAFIACMVFAMSIEMSNKNNNNDDV